MGTIGDRIKLARGKRSQDDEAAMLGIHKNTLARYESGARNPDSEFIEKLLSVHPEINPMWFVTGNGEMLIPRAQEIREEPPRYTIDQVTAAAIREVEKIIAELPEDRQWEALGKIRKVVRDVTEEK